MNDELKKKYRGIIDTIVFDKLMEFLISSLRKQEPGKSENGIPLTFSIRLFLKKFGRRFYRHNYSTGEFEISNQAVQDYRKAIVESLNDYNEFYLSKRRICIIRKMPVSQFCLLKRQDTSKIV